MNRFTDDTDILLLEQTNNDTEYGFDTERKQELRNIWERSFEKYINLDIEYREYST